MIATDLNKILFVDVETTGLSRSSDQITTMTWLFDGCWHCWSAGRDSGSFIEHWRGSQCLCTYNGKCFDEAFICKEFDLPRHTNHFDLRYHLAKHGIRGGLKRISVEVGFQEPPILGKIDGLMAISLWELVVAGEHKALETLICYNALDVARTAYLYGKSVAQLQIPPVPWEYDKQWAETWIANQPVLTDVGYYSHPKRDRRALEVYTQRAVQQPINQNGLWKGSVICFTGKMHTQDGLPMTRKDARHIANTAGFAWVDEVIAGCTHLVAAAGTTDTNKSKRARQLGISIITPSEFWELLAH